MYLWLKHLVLIDLGIKSGGCFISELPAICTLELESLTLTCEKKDWNEPGAENCRVDLSH